MRPFSAGELSGMRATQEGAMMDSCLVLAYSPGAPDSFGGLSNPTYTPGDPIPCGYNPTVKSGNRESVLENKTVLGTNAELRLPVDTVIGPRDRVQITHRHGEALGSPITLEVAGPIKRGPSGLVVDVKKVEV